LKLLLLFIAIAFCCSNIANGKAYNLASQRWLFKLDRGGKMTFKEAINSSKGSWYSISLGDYWQNLGFPNMDNVQRPIVGWYYCSFKLPAKFKNEKIVIRFGAIDDLDKTYLNGRLIGQTDIKTRHYWATERTYPIPTGILNSDGDNVLIVRVEDLRGKGGITTAPFEIIAEKDIPKIEEKLNPLNFRMASLEFSVKYSNPEEAKKAELIKMPLPNGKKWAFSMRWDDNNRKNFRMHDLMTKYGYKGAFYLYSNYRASPKGMNYGAQDAKKLCSGGSVIGGHSMTHPNMPSISKNKMFYEVAAIKIEREKDSNTPVIAFAFPGGAFRSKTIASAWTDIGEALMRCGYHHNCYPVFVNPNKGISQKAVSTVQWLEPGDRKANPKNFDKQLQTILTNPARQKRNPNITWGIHVWLDDEGWKNAENIMKKYRMRKDWWYCSPNDYAAYRYLFYHSTLKKIAQDGSVCRYQLTYLWNTDLGANVPLSFKVKNTTAKNCRSNFGIAEIKTISNCGQIINIYQPVVRQIPKLIDASENINNDSFIKYKQSAKFLELKAWLTYDCQKEKLQLIVKNSGTKAVKNIFLKVWTPLRYQAIPQWLKLGNLNSAQGLTRDIPLKVEKKSQEYNSGCAYFVVQMDFLYNGYPARYYVTVRENVIKL